MSARCPFCGCDPFHYVDNGVCMEAVAVTCCEAGMGFYARNTDQRTRKILLQIIEFRSSPSPRKKARAKRLMAQFA